MIDNTTAVSVINNMGTCHSNKCNSIGIKIWEFCLSYKIIWLTAAHIPGSSNYGAEKESRGFRSEVTEWIIDPTLLGIALDALNFIPQIYLFASWLNRQFPTYCSFKPDPDASTLSWSDKHFYCVLQVLQKIIRDNGCSNVANTIMVPNSDVPSCSSTNHSAPSCISTGKPSIAQKDESSYLLLSGNNLRA